MDGIKIESQALDNAQKYVKLTRALILKRILSDSEELTPTHRDSMEAKLLLLMKQLDMNEEEFDQALKTLEEENSGESLNQQKSEEEREVTLYCLSRKCRHQLTTLQSKSEASKNCPQCAGPMIFSI